MNSVLWMMIQHLSPRVSRIGKVFCTIDAPFETQCCQRLAFPFLGNAELLSLQNELQQADTVDKLSGYNKTSQQYAAAETKWQSRQAIND